MSARSDEHGPQHSELLHSYALQTLAPGEIGRVEANLSSCAGCRAEMAALHPVVDSFIHWPTDVLRPSTSLWERLAERIRAEAGGEPPVPAPERWVEPEWEMVAPGISCKLLAIDTDQNRVSMLVRLAPGAEYPPHRHAGVEELHLLDGELVINERKLHAGDYSRAEPGSVDHRVWSETGCTCVLVTSTRDVIR